MTKLADLKLSLAKRILDSEDEERLRTIDQLLTSPGSFTLSAKQKADLDRDLADHEAGKGRSHTWADVKAHARRSRPK